MARTAAADATTGRPVAITRRELLVSYHRLLETVEGLPAVVPTPPRSKGWLGRRLTRRLRWRWLLRYFAVDHIRRSLAAMQRHDHAQLALGEPAQHVERELAAAERFEKSLPPVGMRHFWLTAVLAVLGLTLLVTRGLAALPDPLPEDRIASFVDRVGHPVLDNLWQTLKACEQLAPRLQATWLGVVAGLDTRKGWDGLLESAFTDWPTFLTFFSLLLLAVYLLAAAPASAFRLKRYLFSSQASPFSLECTCTVRSRATGLYEMERRYFGSLGTRAPGETPVDLLVPMVAAVFWVLVISLNGQQFGDDRPGYGGRDLAILAPLLALPLARLGWLATIWWYRARNPDGEGRQGSTSRAGRAALVCGGLGLAVWPAGVAALFLAAFDTHLFRRAGSKKAWTGAVLGTIGVATTVVVVNIRP